MKTIIHWNVFKKMWTVHTYKGCRQVPVVLILNEWKTETKPLKKDNPKGWVVSQHTNVIINPTFDMLDEYVKDKRLIYHKQKVHFNFMDGVNLLFDETGCHTLIKK